MKRKVLLIMMMLALFMLQISVMAEGSSSPDILKRLKSAESRFKDLRAEMVITDSNKSNVSGMGEGYGDIVRLEKAIIQYKKPNLIRYDGYAKGIKATYIQNGYTKLIIAAMIRNKDNVKDSPGKRQDSLDLGFLSSQLWKDNNVTVVNRIRINIIKFKLVPKFGDKDKRHDLVWVDSSTLQVLKREKYRGNGDLRIRIEYGDFQTISGNLPIATKSTMFDPKGRELGTVEYKNVKVNTGLSDSLFSLSTR